MFDAQIKYQYIMQWYNYPSSILSQYQLKLTSLLLPHYFFINWVNACNFYHASLDLRLRITLFKSTCVFK